MSDLECPFCAYLRAHLQIVRELTEGIGCVLPNQHATVRVDDLNAMALPVAVICRHRPMSEQLACTPNCTSLSFRGHQTNVIMHAKTNVNVGMAKVVNLGAGMKLARVERCEGVKKEGCIKKQDTRLYFYVTNIIIGGDLECAVNNENM